MTLLIIGIVVFLGLHLVPSFRGVRADLIGRLGEKGYKRAYSLTALLGLVLIVAGFWTAPYVQLWTPPAWGQHAAMLLMLFAFIFFFAGRIPGRIKAAVKNPLLVAIKIWALAHLLSNGDLAGLILFGSFLAFAVFDTISVKRRATSAPKKAVAINPRNDFIAVGLGVVVYAAFVLWLHGLLFGRPLMMI